MRRFERALGIAAAAGLVALLCGFLVVALTLEQVTDDEGWFVIAVVALAALALAAFVGQVWLRIEQALEHWESRSAPAWTQCEPVMRFSDKMPGGLHWHYGMESPRGAIARFEGQSLHDRLVLAARALVTDGGEYEPFDGLDVADGDERMQAVVRGLPVDQERHARRWLIIVRDPAKDGVEFCAETHWTPVVTQPSMLAGIFTYTKGATNWQIRCEELHALDAEYVAGSVIAAWGSVARELGLAIGGEKAFAKLRDGLRWDVDLHLQTTVSEEDAGTRLRELLSELRVPVRARILGSNGDRDAGSVDVSRSWRALRAAVARAVRAVRRALRHRRPGSR